MDFLQLRYFKKVAELESMSRAAEELMVSQPSLSKVVKNLEGELGTSLFDRKGRNIELNQNGRILLKHANAILRHMEDARAEIRDATTRKAGKVTLSSQAATGLLPDILFAFHEVFPAIQIIVTHKTSLLQDGSDFFLFASREKLEDPTVRCLLKERCVLAMSPENPLAAKEELTLDDLRNQDFLILQNKRSLSQMLFQFCEEAGFTPHVVMQCDVQSAVFNMIEHNMGVSFVAEKSWSIPHSSNIVLRPIHHNGAYRYIYLREQKDGYISEPARLFDHFLIRYFEKL